MANQIQQLSPKAQENLKRNAELREKDNKFIKLQPSEKRVLEFNPERIEQVEAEFNGKKTQRYRYTVTDPNNGNKQQKCLEVVKRTSEEYDYVELRNEMEKYRLEDPKKLSSLYVPSIGLVVAGDAVYNGSLHLIESKH